MIERVVEILTTDTVAKDDARLPYFAESLRIRGIELEPTALLAFAEKKDRGETETQIVAHADEWTRGFKSKNLTKRILQGTTLGAVAFPVGDWLKQGRPSWREVAKRGTKTVGLGVLAGAIAGWAVGKGNNHVIDDEMKSDWAEFKHNTHEMEVAWTEALQKQASQSSSAVLKEGGPTR